MNFVPYSVDEVNKYKLGETFKAKLRCGGIVNAKASGIFIYLGDRNESCVFLKTGKMFQDYLESFADIIEIEAKPFKIEVGKVYISDSKYPPSTYKIEAKVLDVYIGFCIENHNNIVMFNEDGTVNDGTVNFRNSKHYSNLVKEV